MVKQQIVKTTSLFTLILAFLAIGTTANASVMNNEKGKDGTKEKVVKAEKKPNVKPKMVTSTWHYNGGPADSPTDPSNYSLSTGEPCGVLRETVCKLNAPASPTNPNQPDMDAEVEVDGEPEPQKISDRINAALGGTAPQENETVQSFRGF